MRFVQLRRSEGYPVDLDWHCLSGYRWILDFKFGRWQFIVGRASK